MEVAFYQLMSSPLEQALPRLVEKIHTMGLRCQILCDTQEFLEHINQRLWTFASASFIPHGFQGDPLKHPVWLTLETHNQNNAEVIAVTNGSLIDTGEFKRCVDLFSGHDPQALEAAQKRYMYYVAQGFPVSYWQQDARGTWQKRTTL